MTVHIPQQLHPISCTNSLKHRFATESIMDKHVSIYSCKYYIDTLYMISRIRGGVSGGTEKKGKTGGKNKKKKQKKKKKKEEEEENKYLKKRKKKDEINMI